MCSKCTENKCKTCNTPYPGCAPDPKPTCKILADVILDVKKCLVEVDYSRITIAGHVWDRICGLAEKILRDE